MYMYRLTVTDQDGLSAVTFATVTVNPEPYYPPQALAGKDQLLKLPNTDVTLDGSKSTAFKVQSAHLPRPPSTCEHLFLLACRESCSTAGRS